MKSPHVDTALLFILVHCFCKTSLTPFIGVFQPPDLSKKPFFGGLVDYFASGPIVAMVWEGPDVILTGRKMLGATNPNSSEPGIVWMDESGLCRTLAAPLLM